MNASGFLKLLKRRLRALPPAERRRVCRDYKRTIENEVMKGVLEEAAVAELGDVNAAAERALAEAESRGVTLKKPVSAGKKAFIIALAALLFAVLAGAAALAVLVFGFGYSIGPEPEWSDKSMDIELPAEASLFTELDSFRLTVGSSGDALAHVTYSENENCAFSVDKQQNGLHIRQTEKKHLTSLFRRHDKELRVLLPSGFSGSVTIRTTTGEVSIEDLGGIRTLDVYVNEGDLSVSGVSVFSASLSYTAGDLTVDGLEAESFVRLNGVTGVSEVKNVNTPLFEVNVTAGSMELSAIDAEISRIVATTGSYSISDFDSQDITINLTTGSVNGMLKGRLNDYEIDCGTLTGNCNLPSENNGGPRKLFGRCTTGRIHIYFENEERGQETPVPDWYY